MSGLNRFERYVEVVLRSRTLLQPRHRSAGQSLSAHHRRERVAGADEQKGYSSNDIAELRGVKVETVRSTLKGVFKKTDCHSQNELLLLLQSIS